MSSYDTCQIILMTPLVPYYHREHAAIISESKLKSTVCVCVEFTGTI